MKTRRSFGSYLVPAALRAALFVIPALVLLTTTTHAQVYVTNRNADTITRINLDGTGLTTLVAAGGLLDDPYNILATSSHLYVASATNNSIVRYNLDGTDGTQLISSGLYNPQGLALSGSKLFVANTADGSPNGYIGKYNLDGSEVGEFTAITGLSGPVGLAVSSSNLFVANSLNGTVMRYNLDGTGGTQILSGLGGSIPLGSPFGIAVSGARLFVTHIAGDDTSTTVSEYDFSGSLVNGSFIGTDPNSISALAIDGSYLYATLPAYGQYGVYDLDTGMALQFAAAGGGGVYGIAVNGSAVPEPSTYAAIAGAAMLGFAAWRRRSVRAKAGI